MAIAYDSAASDAAGNLSWSHTCSGEQRLLLIGIQTRNTTPVTATSVTYNGVALTKISRKAYTAGDITCELWYLVAPATGANTAAVTFDTVPTRASAGSISLTGVDQTSPIDAWNETEGDNNNPSVSVVTTVADAWLVDSVSSRVATAHSPTSPALERYDVTAGTSHRGSGRTSGPVASPGSTTIATSSGSGEWVSIAAALKPHTETANTAGFFALF